MSPLVLFVLFVAGAAALGVAPLAKTAAPSDNVLEIVIGNGPHAGTFRPPPSEISCVHFKQQKQFTAVYKDFDASDLKNVGEAGINVTNPDEAGPKRGEALVAFGARNDKRASRYSGSAPDAGLITLTRNGKSADVAFQGRTKDGISLRMTAKCTSVEEF